jgi:Zn-finger nucleic acid-binding protein
MSDSAVGKIDTTRRIIKCPRDKITMREVAVGEATLDECVKCGGRFFDHGEMLAALGTHADPSYWDRPECTGPIADATIHCPRCDGHMVVQTLRYEDHTVDIDRCGHCRGLFLDRDEPDRILAIARRMIPVIEAERHLAQLELAKLKDDDLQPTGFLARLISLFRG